MRKNNTREKPIVHARLRNGCANIEQFEVVWNERWGNSTYAATSLHAAATSGNETSFSATPEVSEFSNETTSADGTATHAVDDNQGSHNTGASEHGIPMERLLLPESVQPQSRRPIFRSPILPPAEPIPQRQSTTVFASSHGQHDMSGLPLQARTPQALPPPTSSPIWNSYSPAYGRSTSRSPFQAGQLISPSHSAAPGTSTYAAASVHSPPSTISTMTSRTGYGARTSPTSYSSTYNAPASHGYERLCPTQTPLVSPWQYQSLPMHPEDGSHMAGAYYQRHYTYRSPTSPTSAHSSEDYLSPYSASELLPPPSPTLELPATPATLQSPSSPSESTSWEEQGWDNYGMLSCEQPAAGTYSELGPEASLRELTESAQMWWNATMSTDYPLATMSQDETTGDDHTAAPHLNSAYELSGGVETRTENLAASTSLGPPWVNPSTQTSPAMTDGLLLQREPRFKGAYATYPAPTELENLSGSMVLPLGPGAIFGDGTAFDLPPSEQPQDLHWSSLSTNSPRAR
ncbi:hypothetical protein DAEQUDRAFT_740771 [Daedalea quercina L-15889]|uniref:Uncharacterized protein n=1 Tax=Daedalea quercina L-15889 TaxID=1314783 RepID=A0A165M546_9APHY|nr:hypothetical protein DAEQUDRAFT_740771 [Daedalea quercina L-15889]